MNTTASTTTPAALPPVRSEPLLACPFCGTSEWLKPRKNVGVTRGPWQIVCMYCGAHGPASGLRDQVETAWNDRNANDQVEFQEGSE